MTLLYGIINWGMVYPDVCYKIFFIDEPTKSSVRIPWTYEEENFLAKCVLFDRASRR